MAIARRGADAAVAQAQHAVGQRAIGLFQRVARWLKLSNARSACAVTSRGPARDVGGLRRLRIEIGKLAFRRASARCNSAVRRAVCAICADRAPRFRRSGGLRPGDSAACRRNGRGKPALTVQPSPWFSTNVCTRSRCAPRSSPSSTSSTLPSKAGVLAKSRDLGQEAADLDLGMGAGFQLR